MKKMSKILTIIPSAFNDIIYVLISSKDITSRHTLRKLMQEGGLSYSLIVLFLITKIGNDINIHL